MNKTFESFQNCVWLLLALYSSAVADHRPFYPIPTGYLPPKGYSYKPPASDYSDNIFQLPSRPLPFQIPSLKSQNNAYTFRRPTEIIRGVEIPLATNVLTSQDRFSRFNLNLHGYGGSAYEFIQRHERFTKQGIIFAAPQGPYPPL